jgi:hypothetical protein
MNVNTLSLVNGEKNKLSNLINGGEIRKTMHSRDGNLCPWLLKEADHIDKKDSSLFYSSRLTSRYTSICIYIDYME